MCNAYGITFAALNFRKDEIQNKKIIEVGSRDVNGSVRALLESYDPKKYIGVDFTMGPSVDIVCDAENLLNVFESNSFDVVISTEVLEHVQNWKKVVSNFKRLTAPGGLLYISSRSKGFPYHAYPFDFWRYETEDIREIFSDCTVSMLEKDPEIGFFAKIKKPIHFEEKDLSSYELYSIISDRRVRELNLIEFNNFLKVQEKFRRLQAIKAKINPFNWVPLIAQ